MTIKESQPWLEALWAGKTLQHRCDLTPNTWYDVEEPTLEWLGERHVINLRIKPEPRMVPLEPADVKPGACVRHETWLENTWSPCAPVELGVLILAQPANPDKEILFISWGQLQGGWSMTTDGGKTWHKCEKEAK